VLGSLACAVAGLGLFALARRRLGDSWWCLVPPLAFYASPLVHDADLYDFHAITLATAFLVWAVWAFAARRPVLAWGLLAIALTCKEDVPLVGMMLGLCYLLGGERRRGLAVLLVCALYFAVVMGVLVPLVNAGSLVETLEGPASRYAWILEDPLSGPAMLLRPDRLRIPLYLLLTGAAVAWRGRRWLLLLVPPLAMGMLSRLEWNTRLTGTYYWLTAAAVIGIACIQASRGPLREGKVPRPLVYLAVAAAVFSLMFSPLPHGMGARWANYSVGPDREALREIAQGVPADAALSVQNNLGPHFSQRRDVAAFPRRLGSADRVLLQLRYLGGPDSGFFVRTSPRFMTGVHMPHLAGWARRLVRDPDWGLVTSGEGFYLFVRGGPDRIPPAEALAMIEADAGAMAEDYRLARRYRSPLARWVAGPVSWADLFGGNGKRHHVGGYCTAPFLLRYLLRLHEINTPVPGTCPVTAGPLPGPRRYRTCSGRSAMQATENVVIPRPAGVPASLPLDLETPRTSPAESGEEMRARFEATVLPHQAILRRLALRCVRNEADAEDLVQDTYLRAFRFFGGFAPGTNALAWLCRILKNLVINRYHKQRREPWMVELAEEGPFQLPDGGPPDPDPSPEEIFFSTALREEVERALDRLPTSFREALALKLGGDLTYREIGEILGRPVGTVMSRLHRGRRLLVQQLAACNVVPEWKEIRTG